MTTPSKEEVIRSLIDDYGVIKKYAIELVDEQHSLINLGITLNSNSDFIAQEVIRASNKPDDWPGWDSDWDDWDDWDDDDDDEDFMDEDEYEDEEEDE